MLNDTSVAFNASQMADNDVELHLQLDYLESELSPYCIDSVVWSCATASFKDECDACPGRVYDETLERRGRNAQRRTASSGVSRRRRTLEGYLLHESEPRQDAGRPIRHQEALPLQGGQAILPRWRFSTYLRCSVCACMLYCLLFGTIPTLSIEKIESRTVEDSVRKVRDTSCASLQCAQRAHVRIYRSLRN